MNLNFEMILGIIFFVVFFILPAFTKKRKPGADEAKGPPVQRPAGSTPERVEGAPARPPANLREALEEVRQRVLEAQEREDAAKRGAASSAPASPAASARSQRPLASGEGSGSLTSSGPSLLRDLPTSAGSGGLGGGVGTAGPRQPRGRPRVRGQQHSPSVAPSVPPVSSRPAGWREELRRPKPGMFGEGEVSTLPSSDRRTARLGTPAGQAPAAGLAMDRRALVTGMIWHEILSEPVARKRLRRTRSLHR